MKKIVGFLLAFCVLLGLPMFFASNQVCFASAAQSTSQSEKESFTSAESAKILESFSAEEDAKTVTTLSAAEDTEETTTFVVSANSAVVFAGADFSSEKIATLKHKDEVFVLTDTGAPVTEFWKEFKFFKIDLKENGIESAHEFGYVLAELLTEKQEEIVAIPNFNAKTNKECHVFSQENNKFVESETTLARGQEIFLYEGFNAKKDFTAVCYVIEGKVLFGFLKTDDISPNGINPVLITCIILIVAVLSIIFAWLFMKGKHVRLKKKKHGKYDLKKTEKTI